MGGGWLRRNEEGVEGREGGKKRGGRDRGQCSGTSCLYTSGRAVL